MIRTRDPLNAFLDRPPVPVAHAARGPLAGLALAVKDIFDVAGWRTGCGNPQRLAQAEPAARNAWAVEALLGAGAAFAGKTQTDELAFSLFGRNSHFPFPVNPKAPERITGGSSSGSAAAVAGSLADIALGSDTGGSVRAPASFCGIWGLRPTHGMLSLEGVMPLAPSLDTVGFFARDAATLGRVGRVLFGAAPNLPPRRGDARRAEGVGRGRAPASRSESFGDLLRAAAHLPLERGESRSPRLLRFPMLDALVLPEAREEYRRIAGMVESVLGPASQETLPFEPDALYWCFRRIQGFEAWRAHGAWLSAADRGLGPGVKERFEAGSQVSAETHAQETALRERFRAALAERLGPDGVLVLPTVPGPAPLVASSEATLADYRAQALTLLCWSGLSGFPQLSLPLGAIEGAPFGISLLGPAGSDLRLLALAETIEAAGSPDDRPSGRADRIPLCPEGF